MVDHIPDIQREVGVWVGVGQALCDLSVTVQGEGNGFSDSSQQPNTVRIPSIHPIPMSSRKRRRSQAFHQEEIEIDVEEPEIRVDEDEVDEKGQEEKEREVWDLVREERYESASSSFPSLRSLLTTLQSSSSSH